MYAYLQKKIIHCQNSYTKGNAILGGGCNGEEAVFKLRIDYNDVESHSLMLCEDCTRRIDKDASLRGYNTKKTTLKRG